MRPSAIYQPVVLCHHSLSVAVDEGTCSGRRLIHADRKAPYMTNLLAKKSEFEHSNSYVVVFRWGESRTAVGDF